MHGTSLRAAAVADAVERVRGVERDMGVTPDALQAIKGILLELTADKSLFPLADFPIEPADGKNAIYRLSEDPDHRFALYASTSTGAKQVPPHDHTTWAVIVGVHGDEHNVFYRRTDDGTEAGKGALEETWKHTVRHGTGVTLMPDDIHAISTDSDDQTVHLHMYGLALEQLHERVVYDMEEGTFAPFTMKQTIK